MKQLLEYVQEMEDREKKTELRYTHLMIKIKRELEQITMLTDLANVFRNEKDYEILSTRKREIEDLARKTKRGLAILSLGKAATAKLKLAIVTGDENVDPIKQFTSVKTVP